MERIGQKFTDERPFQPSREFPTENLSVSTIMRGEIEYAIRIINTHKATRPDEIS